MERIIIYPGRFQPMLSHHADVFKALQAKFPGEKVYIGTSNKVEPEKSPFSFKEKQLIATAQGLDINQVLLAVPSPYQKEAYEKYFDTKNVAVIFAVGEKDMAEEPRFKFDNMDPQTGLNMKLRPNKETGKIEPTYYQMINTYKQNPKPMDERGYIYVIDNIPGEDNEVASASQFRQALKNAPNKSAAKEIFSKQFKEYNEQVFDMIYEKITGGNKMSEQINILRKLAGLGVKEGAPVEFETPLRPEKIKFAPVSKSSAVMSIANRFPQGANPNDPEVKQEEFLKALMKSPESLLSEINERIMPDENGLEVSKKLSELIDTMGERGIQGLEDADRSFVLKIVKVALKKMKLEAGDDREFDAEKGALENVDLSDIRSDYGIEQVSEGGSAADIMMTDCESWIEQCDNAEDCIKGIEDLKYSDPSDADEKYANSVADSYIDKINDKGLAEVQSEILNNAFNDEPEMESFDPRAEQSREEEAYNKLMSAYEKGGEEALAKACHMSLEELDQEMTEFAMDHSLHMDDDRDEVIQRYIEDLVDNADWKDHGEQDFDPADAEMESIEEASCGCCGNDPCDCPKDCDGCRKDEAVEDTTAKALEAAMSELRTLAGLNS